MESRKRSSAKRCRKNYEVSRANEKKDDSGDDVTTTTTTSKLLDAANMCLKYALERKEVAKKAQENAEIMYENAKRVLAKANAELRRSLSREEEAKKFLKTIKNNNDRDNNSNKRQRRGRSILDECDKKDEVDIRKSPNGGSKSDNSRSAAEQDGHDDEEHHLYGKRTSTAGIPPLKQGSLLVESDRRIYYARDDETPLMISQRYKVPAGKIIYDNKKIHPVLLQKSKLWRGTAIVLPPESNAACEATNENAACEATNEYNAKATEMNGNIPAPLATSTYKVFVKTPNCSPAKGTIHVLSNGKYKLMVNIPWMKYKISGTSQFNVKVFDAKEEAEIALEVLEDCLNDRDYTFEAAKEEAIKSVLTTNDRQDISSESSGSNSNCRRQRRPLVTKFKNRDQSKIKDVNDRPAHGRINSGKNNRSYILYINVPWMKNNSGTSQFYVKNFETIDVAKKVQDIIIDCLNTRGYTFESAKNLGIQVAKANAELRRSLREVKMSGERRRRNEEDSKSSVDNHKGNKRRKIVPSVSADDDDRDTIADVHSHTPTGRNEKTSSCIESKKTTKQAGDVPSYGRIKKQTSDGGNRYTLYVRIPWNKRNSGSDEFYVKTFDAIAMAKKAKASIETYLNEKGYTFEAARKASIEAAGKTYNQTNNESKISTENGIKNKLQRGGLTSSRKQYGGGTVEEITKFVKGASSGSNSNDECSKRQVRTRRQPTLYNPQDCSASYWQSDLSNFMSSKDDSVKLKDSSTASSDFASSENTSDDELQVTEKEGDGNSGNIVTCASTNSEAFTSNSKKSQTTRKRRQPILYDPQNCPASYWQSDFSKKSSNSDYDDGDNINGGTKDILLFDDEDNNNLKIYNKYSVVRGGTLKRKQQQQQSTIIKIGCHGKVQWGKSGKWHPCTILQDDATNGKVNVQWRDGTVSKGISRKKFVVTTEEVDSCNEEKKEGSSSSSSSSSIKYDAVTTRTTTTTDEACTTHVNNKRQPRNRRQPTLFDPQNCPASYWRSDISKSSHNDKSNNNNMKSVVKSSEEDDESGGSSSGGGGGRGVLVVNDNDKIINVEQRPQRQRRQRLVLNQHHESRKRTKTTGTAVKASASITVRKNGYYWVRATIPSWMKKTSSVGGGSRRFHVRYFRTRELAEKAKNVIEDCINIHGNTFEVSKKIAIETALQQQQSNDINNNDENDDGFCKKQQKQEGNTTTRRKGSKKTHNNVINENQRITVKKECTRTTPIVSRTATTEPTTTTATTIKVKEALMKNKNSSMNNNNNKVGGVSSKDIRKMNGTSSSSSHHHSSKKLPKRSTRMDISRNIQWIKNNLNPF